MVISSTMFGSSLHITHSSESMSYVIVIYQLSGSIADILTRVPSALSPEVEGLCAHYSLSVQLTVSTNLDAFLGLNSI